MGLPFTKRTQLSIKCDRELKYITQVSSVQNVIC